MSLLRDIVLLVAICALTVLASWAWAARQRRGRRRAAFRARWEQLYPSKRHVVVAWHGEGRSLFHVVDAAAPEDEQPAIVLTSNNRLDAERAAHAHDAAARRSTHERSSLVDSY